MAFDMGAYAYSATMNAIGSMYEAARNALENQHQNLEVAKEDYQRLLDQGGEPIGEWEDGHKLWDQEDKYRLDQLALEDALDELRATSVIAVYHAWERHMPNPDGRQRGFDGLISDARKSDVAIDPNIGALRAAANYFKHGGNHWRKQLVDGWPDRFSEKAFTVHRTENWVRGLHLKEADIWWLLDIAKASQRPIIKVDWE